MLSANRDSTNPLPDTSLDENPILCHAQRWAGRILGIRVTVRIPHFPAPHFVRGDSFGFSPKALTSISSPQKHKSSSPCKADLVWLLHKAANSSSF